MSLPSRLAIPAAALAFALIPLSGATAASYHWGNPVSFEGATLQVCKVPTTKTGPWAVHVRLNATRAKSKVSGLARVEKGTHPTSAGWQTKSYIPRGTVSRVGTFKLPRGSAYNVAGGIGGGQMGNGGVFTAKQIPHC